MKTNVFELNVNSPPVIEILNLPALKEMLKGEAIDRFNKMAETYGLCVSEIVGKDRTYYVTESIILAERLGHHIIKRGEISDPRTHGKSNPSHNKSR